MCYAFFCAGILCYIPHYIGESISHSLCGIFSWLVLRLLRRRYLFANPDLKVAKLNFDMVLVVALIGIFQTI